MDESPPDWARYLFWLISGCLSVCFAEIVSGSYLFPYFTFEGLFIVLPVYALHTLVLAYVVYRFGRPRLYTLFLAGAIFGLYEAYITKIIWSPPWGEAVWLFQGIAVVEALVLVLFWHPLLSFILALFASESLLTRSREILSGLPQLLWGFFATPARTYAVIFGAALLFGLYQGTLTQSPFFSIASALAAGGVIGLLVFIYRRIGLHKYDIRKLLPTAKEFIILLVLLLAMYAIFGLAIRREALPGTIPQLIILGAYVVLFGLLYLSLRRSRQVRLPALNFPARFSWPEVRGVFPDHWPGFRSDEPGYL
ncbi:hypothetical protein [Methanocella sp. MCL-LM]|uniref:hypothetical protein n=1 Tax=Methanocella sp. MCL-LM TaxID=3412035 RepID=UPI003C759595